MTKGRATQTVHFRISDRDAEALRRQARDRGLTLSDFIRRKLLDLPLRPPKP